MTQTGDPVGTATAILGVTATLLPLLAGVLQFTVQFQKRMGSYTGRLAVVFIIGAGLLIAFVGIKMGDVVVDQTSSGVVIEGIRALQVGFVFVALAVLLIGLDVVLQLGDREPNQSTSTDRVEDANRLEGQARDSEGE